MRAVYPGSFDPPTRGHMDIIRRAARLFDEVWVLALVNEKKTPLFAAEERQEMLALLTRDMPNVHVRQSAALLIDEMRLLRADAIVRGLRGAGDYIAEQPVADAFGQVFGAETVFLQSRPEHACVSSSMVRELMRFGGDVKSLVPPEIADRVARAAVRLR